MDNINNSFKNMKINNNTCIICNNIFTSSYCYDNNDILCITCSNKYNEYIFEENNDEKEKI